MQEVKIYVMAAESLGVIRDYANAKNAATPSLVRGVETMLKLRLFSEPNVQSPYPIENLANVVAWKFVMDADYDESTTYKLVADNEHITAATVTEDVDGTEYTYTEIEVPLKETNTVEIDEWLGGSKSKNGLTGELAGFDADGNTVFLLQLENFTVRNRLTSAGDPTEIPSEYFTEAQVRAFVTGLLRNPMEFEYSVDGVSDWHTAQTADDNYYRQRIANVNAEWSSAVMMKSGGEGGSGIPGPQGPQGEKGEKGDTGAQGPQGEPGEDGYTPQRGIDYWTSADKSEIKSYVDEAILNGSW